ncbi:hypothetical protein pneo_cds_327 [Pandoravirus neocaledonia]|uniref:Uncharacterized protein n=1 Tax=Pandoravirus neocaledonia TaxID=2107708 RepID=A0A2U7UBW6_9VIRU|nr:hypothetical protein pneo_cds_327 [Pandoravirus neocaledonia]AVK75934.1 hypothetical protein pneo_cds_327 [Pandoravirus neocaledonia]
MQMHTNTPAAKGSRIGDPINSAISNASVVGARHASAHDASTAETARPNRAWALINNTRRQHVDIGSRGECFERDPIRYMRTVLSLGWSADDDMVMLPTRHMDPTYAEVLVWPVASDDAASSSTTGSSGDGSYDDDDGVGTSDDDRSDWSDDTSDSGGEYDDEDDRAYSSDYDDAGGGSGGAASRPLARDGNGAVAHPNAAVARSGTAAGSGRGR